MIAYHSDEHDALLQRVACGELARESEVVRDLAERCESCRTALDELGLVADTLGSWSEDEHGVLAEARAAVTDDDRARVAQGFRALWGDGEREGPNGTGGAIRWFWRLSVAAVLLTVAFFSWKSLGGTEPDAVPQFLGASDSRCETPVGEVDAYDSFDWQGELVGEQTYTLVIWNEGDDVNTAVRASRLRRSEWTPDRSQKERLGRSIRWQVRLMENGELVDSFVGYARLRR